MMYQTSLLVEILNIVNRARLNDFRDPQVGNLSLGLRRSRQFSEISVIGEL